jgi:hypothetical protein
MADFTITVSLSGTINGRTLTVENTFTLTSVQQVIQDEGYVSGYNGAVLFSEATGGNRGQHAENGVAFLCVMPTTPYATQVQLVNSSGPTSVYVNAGMTPMIYHHGEDFNGAIASSTTGTPGTPSNEINSYTFYPYTPFEYRAIALIKPVS